MTHFFTRTENLARKIGTVRTLAEQEGSAVADMQGLMEKLLGQPMGKGQAFESLQEMLQASMKQRHEQARAREIDAHERSRKAALMKDVNAAYEGRDLLALMQLQLRVELADGAMVEQKQGLQADIVMMERDLQRVQDDAGFKRWLREQHAASWDDFDPFELPDYF